MQTQSKSEMQTEALERAKNGESVSNFAAIYSGFAAKGIAQSDIKPRENVFTFHAWKALGRSVKKGEHGVKVVTFVSVDGAEDENGEKSSGYRMPKTTTVFHITQTELTSDREARFAAEPEGRFSNRRERNWDRRHGWQSRKPAPRDYVTHDVRDPGEDAADRWTESNR